MARDMTTVDTSLSGSLRNTSHWLATFFAGLLTVSVILPPFLLPAAVIAWMYYLLAVGYVRTARDLKRMESNSRSPIFSSFAEVSPSWIAAFVPRVESSTVVGRDRHRARVFGRAEVLRCAA
jgi:hypothetical protein